MLVRRVARPVERVLTAAEGIQRNAPGKLPLVGESGLGLDQAALAFERAAAALVEERARLAAKVDELTRTNRALADARESLLRSEKLATVGRLAAGVAHEVGNPLGAISGYAEIARTRLPPGGDPQIADAVDRIASAAGRIDHTVRSLLDFARPATLDLAPVSVQAALDAALELARVQARFRNVEVDGPDPRGLAARPGPRPGTLPGVPEPPAQRRGRHGGAGVHRDRRRREGRGPSRSRWPTPAVGSPRTTSPASSTRSSRPRRPALAVDWGSPSPTPSSNPSGAPSTPATRNRGVRCSVFACTRRGAEPSWPCPRTFRQGE